MNDQVKVFIIDDSEPTLFMLNLWLDHMDDIEVVGTALVTDEFKERVLESQADVIICNWHMTGRGYAQLQELKIENRSPALISIRDGNYLPLEGVLNQTPETLIPTTATGESLLAAIKRSAEKRSLVAKVVELGLSEAC